MIESRPFDRQLEFMDDESMGRTVRSRNIPQKEWGRITYALHAGREASSVLMRTILAWSDSAGSAHEGWRMP